MAKRLTRDVRNKKIAGAAFVGRRVVRPCLLFFLFAITFIIS